ncbi:protein kinase family protein [Bacillus sp. CGMCC 1.16607]|uniref:protein kinase domain-containing protein n=1 Tax=Bacillus sp. CGMCC 1.16607 TaxID=3351842 RepID=UPI00362D3C71
MMNHSLKNQCKVEIGTVIIGKWHRNQYTIIKELGFGANGIVYLAKHKNQYVALKLSDNGMSITSEVNVLKSFAKVQGSALGPSLLDVDDWVKRTGNISFYVMEYVHGLNFLRFIEEKGKSWVPILILQLLSDLEKLHESGWVFGDLKPDNLIVTGPPAKIRCIDVGGTTIQGRAIKEFTEFFDRGYWGLGSRKADSKYDLFAVGMIFVNSAYPKRFNKTTGGLQQLSKMISEKKELSKYEGFILNALKGHFNSANEMRNYLLNIIGDSPITSTKTKQTRSSRTQKQKISHSPQTRQLTKQKKKNHRWLETLLIIFIVTLLYVFYILEQYV